MTLVGQGLKDSASRPLTPEMVAARWQCSPNHVRNLIRRGDLRAFRVGTRLLRVPADAVEEFEARQDKYLSDNGSPSSNRIEEPGTAIVLTHVRPRTSKRASPGPNQDVTELRKLESFAAVQLDAMAARLGALTGEPAKDRPAL